MLGIGSCSLPEVLVLANHAADCGYGSVLCPPPFYFRSAPLEGLAAFFQTVLDEARLPVLLYHIPQVTGVPISDELLDALGEHERLAGVKDSSGDVDDLQRLSRRFSNGAYLVGSDRLVTAALAAGGSGSISAAASVAPGLVRQVLRGERDQAHLDSLRGLLEDFGLGPSVKSILRRCGLGDFATRPPLVSLSERREGELWRRFTDLVARERRPRAV
jgi:4-hydroxy-tetrahydrodipicolinate synthase